MIFHPGILALLASSLLTSIMICYSSVEGLRIIRHWDITSGSEYQLELERKTYLISTLMGYVMGFQILSLFLFIYTTDTLSHLFTGAMCAAGSLNVNSFGYPTLILKLIICICAGVWLIVNYTDNRAHDYPLVRKKYWMLLSLAPLVLTTAVVQANYLLRLNPDIITSCCSVIFSDNGGAAMSGLLALPPGITMVVFFSSGVLVIGLALRVCFKRKGALQLAAASLIHFGISIVSLIVFISIYIYELPTHHCPFCILHPEYFFIGYFLYFSALISTISGMGAGAINPFAASPSLSAIIPRLQTRLSAVTAVSTSVFLLITACSILLSNLKMW